MGNLYFLGPQSLYLISISYFTASDAGLDNNTGVNEIPSDECVATKVLRLVAVSIVAFVTCCSECKQLDIHPSSEY